MRKLFVWALLVALTLTGPAWCHAPAAGPTYTWWPTNDGHWGLFQGAQQVGWLNAEDGRYYPLLATGTWGGTGEPPVDRPGPEGTVTPTGVIRKRIDKGRTLINGKAVSTAEALRVLGAELPDDAGKLRLTVIGADEVRKAVLNDLQASPALAPYKAQIVVQDYAPGAWPLAAGFESTGSPSIYVQDPSGKVLHRQADYADGPDGLATALRKLDPNYDSKKDPDRRKPSLIPSLPSILSGILAGKLKDVPPGVPVAAALAVLVLITRRRQA